MSDTIESLLAKKEIELERKINALQAELSKVIVARRAIEKKQLSWLRYVDIPGLNIKSNSNFSVS